jgi:hypothetical protein
MTTTQRAMISLVSGRNNLTDGKGGSLVISSMCIMASGVHLCVGSSDNSVTVYELSAHFVSI